MSKYNLPSELKRTLQNLEGTLSDWEKITPEPQAEQIDEQREILEKELQKKAKDILDQLKTQIDELS
jgi:molecular chaperone DnaK (HSP70)